MRTEDLELLEAQCEEKLRRQEIIKESHLEKERIAACKNLCRINDSLLLHGKAQLKLYDKFEKKEKNK